MEIDTRFPIKLNTASDAPEEIFGGIITFVPCLRLKDFRVSRQESFEVLALQVGTAHGGEKLEVMFPSDNEKAILKAMEQMLLSRASEVRTHYVSN